MFFGPTNRLHSIALICLSCLTLSTAPKQREHLMIAHRIRKNMVTRICSQIHSIHVDLIKMVGGCDDIA